MELAVFVVQAVVVEKRQCARGGTARTGTQKAGSMSCSPATGKAARRRSAPDGQVSLLR